MRACKKPQNVTTETFERKLSLLHEYETALKEPIVKINVGDVQFIEGLKSKTISELRQLILDHPELESHPHAPRIFQRRGLTAVEFASGVG